MPTQLRLGTRGSALALAQVRLTRAALEAASIAPSAIAVEEFRTSGDRITDRPLKDIGGKALFTREIDEALRAGKIDVAIHSAKDMESELPEGLAIGAVLPRADVRDCLVGAPDLMALPSGARIGTSAVRRRAQILAARQDLELVPLRGNVDTRIRKWQSGEVDALLLAKAGLDRLGRSDVPAAPLPADNFLPAAGQGVVALLRRAEDSETARILEAICDFGALAELQAERGFVAALGGNCGSPIAAHATCTSGMLRIEGAFFTPDGGECERGSVAGGAEIAGPLGASLAESLLRHASKALRAALKG